MSVIGNVKFNWDASCREAEFLRWKKNACKNFKTNKKTEKESQGAFLWNWLGAMCERVLESQKNGLGANKENAGTMVDTVEQKCHPASNQTLYKNQFFHD